MDSLSIGRFSVHRSSKSADSIPRISQHRPSISERAPLSDTVSKKSSRSSLSWLPPMSWRRPHSPPVIIRSGRELHEISAPLPPILSTSLPSSADLHSHGQGRTLGAFDRRMAASIKEASDPGTTSGPSRRRASTASHDNLGHGAAEAHPDLLALLPLPAKAGPPKMSHIVAERSPTPVGELSDEKWTANVQQLIQETEHAFEAVGHVVSETHLTSWLLDIIEPAAPSSLVGVPTRSSASEQSQTPSSKDQRNKKGLSEIKPLARKTSVTKSQRRKRGRKAGRDVFGGARFQAKTIPWTLAESVGSALSQRFKRVVADEMLTPGRMEELKRGREEAQEAEARLLRECRSSTESNRSTLTDLSDQSVGPFHLESLMDTVAGVADSYPSAAAHQAAAAVIDEDVVRTDFQAPKGAAPQNDEADGTAAITIGDLAFPSPPSKSNSRPGARTAQPARLPTIHEAFCAAPGSLRRRPGTRRRCRARQETVEDKGEGKPKEKEERIYLKSTPLSSANRAFRHGPISFERPEAGKRKGCAEDVDETVDWTAFQMAILGGAGDLMSGLYEDDQNQMADDMAEWFETFGFETPGQLIAANGIPPLDPPHNIYSSSTSTVNSDTNLPIPVQSERPLPRDGGWHGEADAATDMVRFFRSSNACIRRYAPGQEQQKRHELLGRTSKRGPSRPLVVGEEVPEDVSEGLAERVPMGCNLEHDLDEFLRWERQYISGGVF
ncbi:hypothetical protein G6O67_007504 [Ophiocordyceps sinensis]|uniref:Uncharacterized protein n=2 Tax=Ophiocordyceps sinensis TaxID=72228 RepID=A0A8H4PNW4_9HYPO|nr:hypothetical protein OCS_00788 [Ophiocordyceps sinensis CO18]KAF4505570.1 hypothetical protein G6O67_007504 [Ophiocordyceps sinensis]